MIEVLEPEPGDRVLEIGTGSGYAATVLAQVVAEVYTIERLEPLVTLARRRLRRYRIRVIGLDATGRPVGTFSALGLSVQ